MCVKRAIHYNQIIWIEIWKKSPYAGTRLCNAHGHNPWCQKFVITPHRQILWEKKLWKGETFFNVSTSKIRKLKLVSWLLDPSFSSSKWIWGIRRDWRWHQRKIKALKMNKCFDPKLWMVEYLCDCWNHWKWQRTCSTDFAHHSKTWKECVKWCKE